MKFVASISSVGGIVCALACLSLAVPASSYCVSVGPEFHPAAQKARITVLKDGTAQKDAMLVITRAGGEFLSGGPFGLTLKSDSLGAVALPELVPGRYCIIASISTGLSKDLCLEVSNGDTKDTSFSIELGNKQWASPAFKDALKAEQAAPIEIRLKAFAGIVIDPSGALIPKAQIAIFQRGVDAEWPTRVMASDNDGRFAAKLDAGVYTAILVSQGFVVKHVTFEIAADASGEELRVDLKPGGYPITLICSMRKNS